MGKIKSMEVKRNDNTIKLVKNTWQNRGDYHSSYPFCHGFN